LTVFQLIFRIRLERLTHSGWKILGTHLSNSRKFMSG